jgi:hypothetical protein
LEMTLEWYKTFYSSPKEIQELTAKQILLVLD